MAAANVALRDDLADTSTSDETTNQTAADQKAADQKKMEAAISAAERERAANGGPSRAGVGETPYQVHAGDSMWAVAQSHKDNLGQLLKANPQIADPDLIRPGDILFVPTKDAASVDTRRKIADAQAAEHSAAGIESVLRNPKLSSAMRSSLTDKLTTAQGDASAKWAALQKSVEDELRNGGVEKGLPDTATKSLVANIRARALDSEKFQKTVDAALQTEEAKAKINRQVQGIVGNAQNQTAPQAQAALKKDYADAAKITTDALQRDPGALKSVAALDALNKDYARAPDKLKDALLHDPGAQKIIDDAVTWANDPLQHVDAETTAQGRTAEGRTALAIERLGTVTHGLDKTLAGIVVDRAVAGYEKFHADKQNSLPNSGPYSTTLLVNLAGRIAGTPQGDDAISRFAAMGQWNTDAVRNAIGAGADPAYAIAVASHMKARGADPSRIVHTIADGIAMRDEEKIANGGDVAAAINVASRLQNAGLDGSGTLKVATDGMQQFKDNVTADVEKLATHDAELAWLVKNDGATLASKQLLQAVTQYRKDKGAAWQADDAKLRQQIADDGSKLLDQMTTLNRTPSSLSGSRAIIDQTLRTIANDPAAGFAISAAIATDPELTTEASVMDWADIFTSAKVGDLGRKFTAEGAAIFLRQNVLGRLQGTNFYDPESVEKARDALFSLHNATFARLIGVTEQESAKLVKQLNLTANEIAGARNEHDVKQILDEFDNKIKADASLSKTFNKGTRAGQYLRGFAVALASLSVVNSYSKYHDEPNTANKIKLGIDTAGFFQKNSELLTGLGVFSKGSGSFIVRSLAQFGGEWKAFGRASAGDFLAGASAIFDGYSAVHSAQEHHMDDAFFSGATAIGGVLTVSPAFGAAAILGPVGLGVTAGAVIGKAVYQGQRNAHKYEAASKNFLKAAGYNDAAADALSEQSGYISRASGAAQLPFLAKYAALKHMTPDQLMRWVNSLTPDQAENLAKRLLQVADETRGNPDQFTDGPPETTFSYGTDGLPVETPLVNTIGVVDDYLNYNHVPHP